MWSFSLRNPINLKRVYTCQPWAEQKNPLGDEEIFVVEDYVTAFSVWKTVAPTTQSTTIIATPRPGGSIVLTDILMAVKRKNAAIVSLQFTDGSATEILYSADVSAAELYLAHSVKGRMQGWMDARLELVIAGADVDTNVTIAYMKLPTAHSYADWGALR